MTPRRPGLAFPLVALLTLVPSPRVLADVAATGTFDIVLGVGGPPPNVPFDGDITFDAGARTVLGQSVDIASDVGDMTFEGDAVVNVMQESATFDLVAESDGDFEFTASGLGRCESAGCVNGRGTFAGRFATITDPSNVLPDGIYTFDGTALINVLGQGPGGAFAINAFPVTPTPAGSDVEVSSGPQTFFDTLADGIRGFVASARFASVGSAGGTDFVAFSAIPGALPAGIALDAAVSVFVDVSTTATVVGGVRLCLGYTDVNGDEVVDGTSLTVSRLRLLHAAAIGAVFADVTSSAGGERVCGDAPAVGPIVLAVGPAVASTTSTTSTSLAPSASTTTTIAVAPGGSTTTSTTLPVCATALECIDVAIEGPLCPGETLNQKLAGLILKKLTKAQAALLQTRSTTVVKKIAKLVAKARKQIDKVGTKADAFVSKPKEPISSGCRDRIRTAAGRVTQQIEANRI